jgi:hypothetical protein
MSALYKRHGTREGLLPRWGYKVSDHRAILARSMAFFVGGTGFATIYPATGMMQPAFEGVISNSNG